MKMMRFQVTRTEEVPGDVAFTVANEFCEWLDSVGYVIMKKNATGAASDDKSYEDLAEEWVEERGK